MSTVLFVNVAEATLEKQADHGCKSQGIQAKFRKRSSGEIQVRTTCI